jgi:hypothetical protein
MNSIPGYLDEPVTTSSGETICYTEAQLKHLISYWKEMRKKIALNKISEKDLQHLDTLPKKFEAQLKTLQHELKKI